MYAYVISTTYAYHAIVWISLDWRWQVTRLGINVPNQLLGRLKPFREHINISEVCREALEERVSLYERATEEFAGITVPRAIEMGLEEIGDKHVNWTELGIEDAKLWLEKATLDNIDHVLHNLRVFEQQNPGKVPGWWILLYLPGVPTIHDRMNEHQDWLLSRMSQTGLWGETNPHAKAEGEYTRAWVAYVKAAWNAFEDRFTAKFREQETALAKELTSPKVPESWLREAKLSS
jgi:hypothetical protein